MQLVPHAENIRLAMVGMVDGNGHPYSWSAIINGRYDPQVMAECGYPVIPQYLGAQPPEALGIPGVKVTHIWCDQPEDAAKVSRAVFIPSVVDRPGDVIGHVDAVVIPTDIGGEHLDRARIFIEAGLPVFIDKPLTDREDHLCQFIRWHDEGKAFCSTSCMRYAREFAALRQRWREVGDVRLITMTMCKTWDRYGIHALEAAYPLLKPGCWRSVTQHGDDGFSVSRIRCADDARVLVMMSKDMFGGFGYLNVHGTKGTLSARFEDTFSAFKAQLAAFVDYLRTGHEPAPFHETAELMKLVIAGLRSRSSGGREVLVHDIAKEES